MILNQMHSLMAAQAQGMANQGLQGLAGQQAAYNQMSGHYPRSIPRLTTMMIMRSEVREWLKDWDK